MKREPNARGTGEALRGQLVAAANDLLLAPQSIALPSLRAVARQCNVSPAAVYLHFASQQALIEAVISLQLQNLREHIERAIDDRASAKEQCEQFARGYVSWAITHPGAYQLLFESADRLGVADDSAHDTDPERWYLLTRAASLIAASSQVADPRLAAVRVWTALHGLVSLRIHKPANDWPALSSEIAHVLDAHAPSAV